MTDFYRVTFPDRWPRATCRRCGEEAVPVLSYCGQLIAHREPHGGKMCEEAGTYFDAVRARERDEAEGVGPV